MRKSRWIETEKELELINGEWVDKKKKMIHTVGMHPRNKEIWELIFKFFAAVAIFSPFLIITLQNRSQSNKERKSSLSLVYAGILTDLRVYQNSLTLNDTSDQRDRLNRLSAEYPAKLALYGSNKITKGYDTVVHSLGIWEQLSTLNQIWARIQAQTDLLGNASDYVVGDSVVIMQVKTYRRDTTYVMNKIQSQFTEIDVARLRCEEIVKALEQFQSKGFVDMRNELSSTIDFLKELDKLNAAAWDALTNETHAATDEVVIYRIKDYDRMAVEAKACNSYLVYISNFLAEKKSEMQSLFRDELK